MQLIHLPLMLLKLQIYSECSYKLKENITNRYTERRRERQKDTNRGTERDRKTATEDEERDRKTATERWTKRLRKTAT